MRKPASFFIVGLLLCIFIATVPASAHKTDNLNAESTVRSLTNSVASGEQPLEKINLVWQHDNLPSVDLSTLPKVPGVNVVSPCWYVIGNEFGNLNVKAVEGYVARAHAKGYQVWPLITNGFDPDRTKKLLQDDNAKHHVIQQLLTEAETHGFDGINLDFENIYQEDKDELTKFVKQIRKATKKRKLTLSIDVTMPEGSPNWSLCFDRKKLADQVDYVILMAYDQYSGGSPMAGPTASYNWDKTGLQATLLEVPANKLIMGIPLYMRLWHFDAKEKRFRAKTLSMPQAAKIHEEKSTDETYRCLWLEKEKMLYVSYMEKDVPYCFWQENEQSLRYKAELVNTFRSSGLCWKKHHNKKKHKYHKPNS